MQNRTSLAIIQWYKNNARNLPWRETQLPYRIWLSEIILQQTRVAQGLPYYILFINKFPDIESLANASEDEVLHLWQGLGYYSRARNMHLCARKIVNDFNGVFPNQFKQLLSLPGIGQYTAAAIASFAFGQSVPAIDGNVIRVLSRIFGVMDAPDSKESKDKIEIISKGLIVDVLPSTYNQAMMEFGAMLCTPKNPSCGICPVNERCYAYENKVVGQLPSPKKKVKIKPLWFYYLVIEHNENTYIEKRINNDIWKNLYQFPLIESDVAIEMDAIYLQIRQILDIEDFELIKVSSSIKHNLTHRRITAHFIQIKILEDLNLAHCIKVRRENIEEYAFPTLILDYIKKNY